jgi:hypothetical protein
MFPHNIHRAKILVFWENLAILYRPGQPKLFGKNKKIFFLSKYTMDAKNVYAPLVMVSTWDRKRTLADKTIYQNGSIDTSFDPPISLDSTLKSNQHQQVWSHILFKN